MQCYCDWNLINLIMGVDHKVCIDNTLVWYLILEYLDTNWSFFKEMHNSFTNFHVNTFHYASKVQNLPSGSFVVWPIKTALAGPRMLYIIITTKCRLVKPGQHADISSDSTLCMECVKMRGPGLKPKPKWHPKLQHIYLVLCFC